MDERYCSKLTSETKEAYIEYINRHEPAYLPNKDDDPELHDLVNVYQKHTNSKTCRKYKKSSNIPVDLILANSSQIDQL